MRLICRYCMTEKEPTAASRRGYAAAARAAAVVSNPPARVTTSWRCPGCGQMNRTGKPIQGDLFNTNNRRS